LRARQRLKSLLIKGSQKAPNLSPAPSPLSSRRWYGRICDCLAQFGVGKDEFDYLELRRLLSATIGRVSRV